MVSEIFNKSKTFNYLSFKKMFAKPHFQGFYNGVVDIRLVTLEDSSLWATYVSILL